MLKSFLFTDMCFWNSALYPILAGLPRYLGEMPSGKEKGKRRNNKEIGREADRQLIEPYRAYFLKLILESYNRIKVSAEVDVG